MAAVPAVALLTWAGGVAAVGAASALAACKPEGTGASGAAGATKGGSAAAADSLSGHGPAAGAPAAAGSPKGDLDAVVLACAGIDRLGLDWAITQRIDPDLMLPAPGQGSLAVEVAAGCDVEALGRGVW